MRVIPWLLLLLWQTPPLRIATTAVPTPVVAANYAVQLQATGGTPPYKWSVSEGALPAGVHLEPSGRLAGTPTKAGPMRFTVRLTDSASPPQSDTREFGAAVLPPLEVRWKRPPLVQDGGIFGAVAVSNNLPRSIELTLIIVAVNEIGKAFVLGYEHPTMPPQTSIPEIRFGTTLPRGSYVVHVDAVGEDPETEALFRARLQTPTTVPVP